MKLKEIEANVVIKDSDGKEIGRINSKAKYDEPESIQEFLGMKSLDQDDKLRIILYGLNTYHQTILRKNDDMAKAAKIMFEAKLFPSFKSAYEHLVGIQRANASLREQVNPAA